MNWQALLTLRFWTRFCERTCRDAFYDRQTVISLQDIHNSFEKLRFLIRQRELLFKLFDALLWR